MPFVIWNRLFFFYNEIDCHSHDSMQRMLLHVLCVLVAQSCLTLWPYGCSPPGSSVCGILQARILEWVAISFSRGFPWPRIEPESPALVDGFLTPSATREALAVFSSVQSLSCVQLCDPMNRSTLGLPVHHQLPESTQTHVHQVSDAILPSHPLSSLILLPSVFPMIRVFSNESVLCIRWLKVWCFSFNISPSNSGLISFRIDWFDLHAVQGTLKSLL